MCFLHTCSINHHGSERKIENGSPRRLLNQATASSVCSVIAWSADGVVFRGSCTGLSKSSHASASFVGRGGSCGYQTARQTDRFGTGRGDDGDRV